MIDQSTQMLRPAYVKAGEGLKRSRIGQAGTLAELAELAEFNPIGWARRVWESRQSKREAHQ